jgi:hypothetical protein
MLVEGLGFGWGETVYSGVTFPLVEPGLRHAVRLGFRRIVVFPYFLFSGVLVSRIRQHTALVAADHPELEFIDASYLGDHPLVVETFRERLDEVLRGEVGGVFDFLLFAHARVDGRLDVDAQFLRQVAHRVDEGLPHQPLHEADRVAAGLTPEALEALLVRPHIERRRLLTVKRAQPFVAATRLLQLDPMALNERDHVDALAHLLNLGVGDQHPQINKRFSRAC